MGPKKVQGLQSYLLSEISAAWPDRYGSRYQNARALLVCWADHDAPVSNSGADPGSTSMDDILNSFSIFPGNISRRKNGELPFVEAAYQLADVFVRRYGIPAQVWMIPTLESPQDALAAKVTQFVHDFGGPENLLIFWYGGRADFVAPVRESVVSRGSASDEGAGSSGGELVWYGSESNPGIQARSISRTLGTARADVLMLNDCPYAEHAYHPNSHGPIIFELLGAGSPHPSTLYHQGHNRGSYSSSSSSPLPPHRIINREASFTRTLTLMLDSPFAASRGVPVVELHRKLVEMVCPTLVGQTAARRVFSLSPDAPLVASPPAIDPDTGTGAAGDHSNENTNTRSGSNPTTFIRQKDAPMSTRHAVTPPAYPVYCQTSATVNNERDEKRSIVISVMDNVPSVSAAPEGSGDNRANVHWKLDKAQEEKENNKTSGGLRLDIILKPNRPRVSLYDARRWKDWILRAPRDVEDVSVSALNV
ncbi:hypothetical protein F5Y16DRAFT_397120 [Xylariaceae sp. FL0255]|nr:hypothetical protein F5Y16DRAFT_397120 [Xylariaceae sp. FL0255]